ncbi:MAG TPA: hypothetical protein PLU37_03940 [Chitinophagaceae bacterium]|nr:hypothetical protein [Chitinophagaceae bacterium]
MKTLNSILFLLLLSVSIPVKNFGQTNSLSISFDFFGTPVSISVDPAFKVSSGYSPDAVEIADFFEKISKTDYQPVIYQLLAIKSRLQLEDWPYYQLIRNVAEKISPKAGNYYRYTLYKWFLMDQSGYETALKTSNDKLLFYIRCDENIYNIPGYYKNDKQFICLNYHDYGNHVDFQKERFTEISPVENASLRSFSYKITRLPDFNTSSYKERDISFQINDNEYRFKIKLNNEIKTLFANYPVVDYESYFNIPLSKETYESLIPVLKNQVSGMNKKAGVDFLMRFTRYAFMFAPDSKQFGGEKRLSPEETLLYDKSDCDDRAALFFYLVKEIYNLPMIVLAYPEHVTIAVKFAKPVGTPVVYKGEKYSVCEPTPQKTDLRIGQSIPGLNHSSFEVVYAYHPGN